VEGVDVLKTREAIEYSLELFAERLGRELHLARVEALGSISSPPRSVQSDQPLILLILNPDRIWVGSRLCVRLRTISMNS
jgi:hypothetical protein